MRLPHQLTPVPNYLPVMVHRSLIPLTTGVLSAHYSISPSHGRTSHILFNRCVCIFTCHGNLISPSSSTFFVMSWVPWTMVSTSMSLIRAPSPHAQMLTGLAALTFDNPHPAIAFSWATTSYLGLPSDKPSCLNPVLRLNIKRWHMLLPSAAGSASSFRT
jgi:hypothetical protein